MIFIPHGECLLWDWRILTVKISGDALTFIAYMVIPLLWGRFAYSLLIRYGAGWWFFILGGLFVFCCGMTHLTEIMVLEYPSWYWPDAIARDITGVVSILFIWYTWRMGLNTKNPEHIG
ncbi:MAG: hypothetical protein JO189_31560 [Deltaproteobacteria bacterium]|nr:hypothetical protein [Deltaproteobacteria bacterium]